MITSYGLGLRVERVLHTTSLPRAMLESVVYVWEGRLLAVDACWCIVVEKFLCNRNGIYPVRQVNSMCGQLTLAKSSHLLRSRFCEAKGLSNRSTLPCADCVCNLWEWKGMRQIWWGQSKPWQCGQISLCLKLTKWHFNVNRLLEPKSWDGDADKGTRFVHN